MDAKERIDLLVEYTTVRKYAAESRGRVKEVNEVKQVDMNATPRKWMRPNFHCQSQAESGHRAFLGPARLDLPHGILRRDFLETTWLEALIQCIELSRFFLQVYLDHNSLQLGSRWHKLFPTPVMMT